MAVHVSIEDLVAARAAGVVLVDVREPEEFDQGHVPGALSIPMTTVPARVPELAALAADGPVHLICRVGGRSAHVADYLAGRGVASVTVDGGTDDWVAAGHPLAV